MSNKLMQLIKDLMVDVEKEANTNTNDNGGEGGSIAVPQVSSKSEDTSFAFLVHLTSTTMQQQMMTN